MHIMIHRAILRTACLLTSLLTCFTSAALAAPTIWDGPPLTFTKAAFADPTLPENQDRITDNVWITRANDRGIYNAAIETEYDKDAQSGPLGTEWAIGTTADVGSLVFNTWYTTIGGNPVSNMVGRDMVLHLIEDDIYLDIRFLPGWGQAPSQGGFFSYTRSTGSVVPEPSTVALVALAFVAVVGWRRLAG